MSVQIIIHGETAAEALQQLIALAGVANATMPSSNENSATDDAAGAAAVFEEPVTAKPEQEQEKPKKRKRRTKAEMEAARAAEAEADPTPATAATEEPENDSSDESDGEGEPEAYTVDDVRNAVQRHAAKHGLAKTRDLLSKYGAGKVTEVKAEHYADLIGECPAEE